MDKKRRWIHTAVGKMTITYVIAAFVVVSVVAAIAMFVLGHKIEGNLRMMAPVLLFWFLRATLSRRKVARYLFAKRVHFLRA